MYYLYSHHLSCADEFYPMIRIAGKYLKQFNFNIDDRIEVECTTDEILIRKVPPDAPLENKK